MVYRIALSHTLDRHFAEDIFQKVFLNIFKNQHKIKDEQHLKHWLIRTDLQIYAHSFQSAQAATMDAVAEALPLTQSDK